MVVHWNDKRDIVRHGQAVYEKPIRVRMEQAHAAEIVVLDVYSGDYEVHADKRVALDRLLFRLPEG